MTVNGRIITMKDKGAIVEVSAPVSEALQDLNVYSTTTQLRVTGASGKIILDVPQLYSTVDAALTEKTVKDGALLITLHKLSPNEQWSGLETEEIQARNSRIAPANASEGAMEARELVRQLFEACLHGRLQEIQSIAPRVSTAGLNNVKDGNGRNALHFAAQGGQTEIVQYLLQNEGVSIDSQDDTGETPLGLAAGAAQLEVIKLLVEEGAMLGLTNSMPQPLHRSAATGNRDIVALLVEKGAELDAPSESGTPLMWAAGSGHSEVVTELLESGADPNAQAPNGATAMILAAVAGNADIIDQLGERKADANLALVEGVTALHAASDCGDRATVDSLLRAGANPDAIAMDGDNESKPIHAAAFAGQRAIVELLLPLTKPLRNEEWTVEALMTHASHKSSNPQTRSDDKSTEASSLQEGYDPELAGGCKREGDGAFGRKEFQEAESFYTDSLKYDASNHLVWANRSAARFRQGKAEGALQDAQKSRELDPKYLKAWYREGEAARSLEQYETAAQAFYEAYTLDPSNSFIAQDFQDAVAKGRAQYAQQQAQGQPLQT